MFTEHYIDINVEGPPLPHWLKNCEFPVFDMCVDFDLMGAGVGGAERGGSYPIHVKIPPVNELQVKIYDPLLKLIFDKTFKPDSEGFVTAEYNVPNDAAYGLYNVLLLSKGEAGKNYRSHGFGVGGTTPWGSAISAGEILFQAEGVRQSGRNENEYYDTYTLNNPITVNVTTVTPYPREILADRPVYITLYGPDEEVVEQITKKSDEHGKMVYTFTPTESGRYKTIMTTEYQELKDSLLYFYPVGIESGYEIFAEGKEFQITLEGDWYRYSVIKEVAFSKEEKRLSIEIAKTDIFNILRISIPYELLNGQYTTFVDGEQIQTDAEKRETSAVIHVPIDDTVNRVEIIGTTVVPEFPVNIMAITAIGLIGVLISFRLRNKMPI